MRLRAHSTNLARIVSSSFVLLLLIVLLSLFLRLRGNGFGLPFEYHIDEFQYVRQAAKMGQIGLEPTWWNNPPFYKYLLLAEYGGLFVAGRLMGLYSSAAEFGAQQFFDPTLLYLLGRGTSALFGSLTVLLIYLAGKSGYSNRTGLVAAVFLGSCFLHARDSHYATNDVAVTFMITAVMFAALRIVRKPAWRWYVLAGIALGLGFATKYTAAPAALMVLIAHVLAPDLSWKRPLNLNIGRIGLFGIVAILAATAASPYFILTPGNVVKDVYEALYLAGQRGFDGWQIDASGGYAYYLKSLLWGFGALLLLASLFGLVNAFWRRGRQDLILGIYSTVVFLYMGQQNMYFARFLLPIVPPLLLLAAALVVSVRDNLVDHIHSRHAELVFSVMVLLIILQPLASTMRHNYLLQEEDTRTIAKNWIEEHVPSGTKIAVDWPFYGPPLATDDEPRPDSNKTYEVLVVERKGLSHYPLDWYQSQGYDYLVTSSFISEIELSDEPANMERLAFYRYLESNSSLVFESWPTINSVVPTFIFDEVYGPAVSIWQRQRPGPVLMIYDITYAIGNTE